MLIKVCCIRSAEEARCAAAAGATYVGLVGEMPSGPGPIGDDAIRDIVAEAPAHVTTVLLTSRTEPEGIADHVVSTGVAAVQIVSRVDAGVRRRLRELVPSTPVLQVVHVEGPEAVEVALAAAEAADFVLLDSGRPSAGTPELGGTGRPHDWTVSREIVRRLEVPVLLAGGLAPFNVTAAVRAVRPAGVDACSGLRSPDGRLDEAALRDFSRLARAT